MTQNKINHLILIATIIIVSNINTLKAQIESKAIESQRDTIQSDDNLYLVTFECKPCKEKNKFSVSGKESFTLKKVEFPLERKLKPGNYKMTYWQNKVQQIHLPFSVKPDSLNRIIVKE